MDSSLRDQMGGVFRDISSPDQVLNLGSLFKFVQELIDLFAGFFSIERMDPNDDPEGEAIPVGIEKPSSHHPFREGTGKELGRPFVFSQPEPVFNRPGIKPDDLFEAESKVLEVERAAESLPFPPGKRESHRRRRHSLLRSLHLRPGPRRLFPHP